MTEVYKIEAYIKSGETKFQINHNLLYSQVTKLIATLIKQERPAITVNEGCINTAILKLISSLEKISQEEINTIVTNKIFKTE